MHTKQKAVFLVLSLSIWSPFSADVSLAGDDTRFLISRYENMLLIDNVDKINMYYTEEYVEGLKTVFRNKCGFKCTIFRSESWVNAYETFISFEINRRNDFNVIFWAIKNIDNKTKKLNLIKAGCGGKRAMEELTYEYKKQWLVGGISSSSWTREIYNNFNYQAENALKKVCDDGEVDSNVIKYISQ